MESAREKSWGVVTDKAEKLSPRRIHAASCTDSRLLYLFLHGEAGVFKDNFVFCFLF